MSTLRRASIILLGWGAWLGVITALQAIFDERTIVTHFEFGLLGGASFACLIVGTSMFLIDLRGRWRVVGPSALVESSTAVPWFVVSLDIALLGSAFGLWAVCIGSGLMVVSIGALVREGRAQRRTLASAVERFTTSLPTGQAGGAGERRQEHGAPENKPASAPPRERPA